MAELAQVPFMQVWYNFMPISTTYQNISIVAILHDKHMAVRWAHGWQTNITNNKRRERHMKLIVEIEKKKEMKKL